MGSGAISISRHGDYTRVVITSRDGKKTTYGYKTEDEYTAPYLSVENLPYYVSLDDVDEEDDYLLYHALQEEKKVAACFWTRNEQLIRDAFCDDNMYNVASQDTWQEGFKRVFVSRKGSLSDYFDIDGITDWYDDFGIHYSDGLFFTMCNMEIITLMTGGYCHYSTNTKYSPIICFEGDDVLRDFGAAALMVSGLLFGYPLESTVDLIRHIVIY